MSISSFRTDVLLAFDVHDHDLIILFAFESGPLLLTKKKISYEDLLRRRKYEFIDFSHPPHPSHCVFD